MRKPDFQRFLTAITCGTPDRVPAVETWVDTEIKELFLNRSISTPYDEVDFWVSAGYDYVVVSTKGQHIPDKVSQETLTHQQGQRTHEHRWAMSGQGAVTTWAAFEDYPWITTAELDYGAIDSLRDCLPDEMLAVANQGPLYSGVWRLMGLEAFSYALVDNPALVAAVYEKVGELSIKITEAHAQREWVGALWLGDDIAYSNSLMTSPAVFRKYALPYYRRIGKICRQYNKPLIYHSDGNVLPVIEDLIEEVGIVALHPIEPKAMDIRQIKLWQPRGADGQRGRRYSEPRHTGYGHRPDQAVVARDCPRRWLLARLQQLGNLLRSPGELPRYARHSVRVWLVSNLCVGPTKESPNEA